MNKLLGRIGWANVVMFVLFFALASLMWYGHAMQSVRNTRVPVYIQYTGKPGSIGLGDEGLPDKVMIEVRDAGARLNSYHKDPLSLTIDLRSYIHGEQGTIHIPSDALRRGITGILQGTSKLIEASPEEISCSYFTEQEKTVTVAFDGDIHLANGYQLVGQPKLNRTTVTLYGSERGLRAVDTLYTRPVTLRDISDTTVLRVALDIPKTMRADYDSVTLTLIPEQFTEKKFKLPIRVTNVPDGYHIRLFPSEVEVNARVGISHFARVKASDIIVSCVYSTERTDKLDVEIHYSNPYITSVWAYPGTVEYLLEQ